VAHADDAVGRRESAALEVHDRGVAVLAAAVELGRVDVGDEGLARRLRGGDAGRVGHPVVGVNDVELLAGRDSAHDVGVARDLGEEIRAVEAPNDGARPATVTRREASVPAAGPAGGADVRANDRTRVR